MVVRINTKPYGRWVTDQEITQVENIQGPIQDAIHVDGNWWITGWREDLQWKQNESDPENLVLTSSKRVEIGNRIIDRGEEGYWVLDNRGQWTPFAVD